MAWVFTIGGVDQSDVVQRANVHLILNERGSAQFLVDQIMPDRFAEVQLTEMDGVTPLFGGIILSRVVQGYSQADDDLQVELNCTDFFTYADWASITISYDSPVTLKQVLTDIVAVLSVYGISLDAGQATGPTLDPFTWSGKRCSDAIREVVGRAGYVSRISPDKKLKAFIPGTDAAPFAITDGDPHAIEVKWKDSDRTPATKVLLICGPSGILERTQTWTGDGSTTSWVTDVPAASDAQPGYVTVGGVFCTVGPGAMFEWNAATSTLSVGTAAVPGVGVSIVLVYNASYPFTVTSDSGGSPPIEYREEHPDVLDPAQGQSIADALVIALNQSPREMTIDTDEGGIEIGDGLSIDLPFRGLASVSAIVTMIDIEMVLDDYWTYAIAATESETYQGSYLDQWRQITGGGSSGIASVSGSGGSVSATVLSSPFFLGGSRNTSIHLASAAWTPAVNHVDYVAPASFTARVRVDLWAREAGVGVTARLRNVTDGTDVESSKVTSQTASPVTIISPIVAGKKYRLELLPDTNDVGMFGIGTMEAA